MSAYEFITGLDEGLLDQMMELSIIRSTLRRDLTIYRFYLEECGKGRGKMMARTTTADKFGVSEETVSKIIQKMK